MPTRVRQCKSSLAGVGFHGVMALQSIAVSRHGHPIALKEARITASSAWGVAGALKAVDDRCDPARGDTQGLCQVSGSEAAAAPDDLQAVEVCAIQSVAIGRKPVDLRGEGSQFREHGFDQMTISLGRCLTI